MYIVKIIFENVNSYFYVILVLTYIYNSDLVLVKSLADEDSFKSLIIKKSETSKINIFYQNLVSKIF